jgi:uncharacterized membrane protein
MDSPENYKPDLEHGLTDEQMDRIIGNLLRIGLILSAVLVLFGAVFYLTRHGNDTITYHTFRGEPSGYRHIQGILKEAFGFHGRGFILMGLILLIATPVARVVFSVLAFLRQRDFIYVVATSIVLGILLFSLVWGGGIR